MTRPISEWQELGLMLRQRRNYLALTPEDVFEKTHISVETVNRLETGFFNEIPAIYLQDFLKRYAALLGLTEQRVFDQYERGLAEYETKRERERHVHRVKTRIGPLTRWLKYLVGLLAIVLAVQFFIVIKLLDENQLNIRNDGPSTVTLTREGNTYRLEDKESLRFPGSGTMTISNPDKSVVVIQYGQYEKEISWTEFEVH
ncbi:MAG: hypothetical protein GXY29_08665 [Thermotogaceae bacterium]|nr:hypothetical protein [Thermotogaceae bacterium]